MPKEEVRESPKRPSVQAFMGGELEDAFLEVHGPGGGGGRGGFAGPKAH